MTAFTNSIPAASNTLAHDQPLMLANNQYLQTSIGVDHNFTANTGTSMDGYHKVVHFVKQNADPGNIVNVGQLYTKTVGSDVQLFWLSGVGVAEQLSAASGGLPSGNGFAFITGGILLQWGKVASPGSSGTVTFPFVGGFPSGNPPFSLQVTLQRNSAGQIATVNSSPAPSATGFSYLTSSGGSSALYWFAIGN